MKDTRKRVLVLGGALPIEKYLPAQGDLFAHVMGIENRSLYLADRHQGVWVGLDPADRMAYRQDERDKVNQVSNKPRSHVYMMILS